VPHEANLDTYLVLDDFGRLGCSWRETDAERTDRETVIRDLVEGQYSYPVRIVAFNTAEGWSRDVTVDISDELRRRFVEFGEVPDSILNFLDENRR
jgi:Fe2+ transport system protein FeoA